MTPPTIHINGTSRDSLLEGYGDAYHAMHQAREAVQNTAPNARDYYVNPDPSAYTAATAEHYARLKVINGVMEELVALADVVADAA